MRKKIVSDEIYKTVRCDAQADGKRNRFDQRFFGKNHQTDRDQGEDQAENIIEFKPAFARRMMRDVNSP